VECPNCAFHNTPGTPACVRCAGRLDFSDVDVIPQRAPRGVAGRSAAQLRRLLAFRLRDLRNVLYTTIQRPRWMRSSYDGISPAEVMLCVIPGLPHIRRGHRVLGRVLFTIWASLLVVALLNIGSPLSFWTAVAAVSVHCTAISLLFSGVLETYSMLRRVELGLKIYAAVAGLIYLPVYFVTTRFVRVIPINLPGNTSLITTGDVLLTWGPLLRNPTPERGEIVFYRTDALHMTGVIIHAGEWVDRVLGIPGDFVEVQRGKVFVNGELLERDQLPLGGAFRTPDMNLKAGENEYIILPTLLNFEGRGYAFPPHVVEAMTRLSVVSGDAIESRVLWRVRPWNRAGRIEPLDQPERLTPGATQ